MNRILYVIVLTVVLPLSLQAQKTVNVVKGGTLVSLISEEEKYEIQELTVTGELNGADLALLRDMAGNNIAGQITEGKLKVLDLSGANIVSGGMYLDTDRINFQEGGNSATGSFHLTAVGGIMPNWCFYACNSLKEINLPKTVTAIGKGAFMDSKLTSITVPDGIKNIGERAFYHNIYLKAFKMPASARHIGPNAFAYSDELTEIDIPYSVTKIGKNAFRKCSAITKVNCHMAKPCEITDKTFESVATNATLYVPKGTKAAYEAAEVWKTFKAIVETEEEPVPAPIDPGDANGDDEINAADIVEVVNYMTGKPSESFVFSAADVTGNGTVDTDDIKGIVDIIMKK